MNKKTSAPFMQRPLLCALCLLCASAASAQSPYISRVYEYMPAPGQFVNEMPEWEEGDDAEAMRRKAEACLANHAQQMISLGGWGGYVTFGFDHTVRNRRGHYDLKILGNAFYSATTPADTTRMGGNSEPGIVMVSRDVNGNGLPDDPWYELAGSAHNDAHTLHGYTCTYHRPRAGHVPTPSPTDRNIADTSYIRWTDSAGQTGYVMRNAFHRQDYFPRWTAADSLTFTGTRLPDNAADEGRETSSYILYCFDWGYADDQPNYTQFTAADVGSDSPLLHVSEFKIDWAVDGDGRSIYLPGIDFVRVYTGVNQYNGWIGEASTEVLDAWDLHLLDADGQPVSEPDDDDPYDVDGDGSVTIGDITTLIQLYLTQ